MSRRHAIYRGLPLESLAAIEPIDVRDYALGSGWQRDLGVDGGIALFHLPGADPGEFHVPLQRDLDDYAERVGDAVLTLAETENRSPDQVLEDLLASPKADVIRFAVQSPKTARGTIALSAGMALFEGIQRCLLSAAHGVLEPKPYHPRLSRAEAEQLLRACTLGQTERGSFAAKVACPLDAVEDPRPILQEPFTRQVTEFFMRSVGEIPRTVDADQFDEKSQPGLSVNLCDALSLLRPDDGNGRVSVAISWARSGPKPKKEIPRQVMLRPEDFTAIDVAAARLRPRHEPHKSLFAGTVEQLRGSEDEDGRIFGDVTLAIQHDGRVVSATTQLKHDDHLRAIDAYKGRNLVSLRGTLGKAGRRYMLSDVEEFKVLS